MSNERLKVIITKGLPASGKTTFAKEWVANDPENRVRVEKDEIRKDSHLFKSGSYSHKRGDESIVIAERDRQIRQALSSGKSVVSSDTNLVQKHITKITNIAKEHGAEVEVKSFLDVPLSTVIERDSKREDSVGEQVIRRMFHEQVKSMPTFLKYDINLPWVVVTDLDGTLTMGPKNRSPYEWKKVGNDDLNLGLSLVLSGIRDLEKHYDSAEIDRILSKDPKGGKSKLFIFSGRDEICRPETEAWLEQYCIDYDELYMRQEGDHRGDDIVKAEMIDKYIKGKYNVLIWFDDRVRVSNMLRDVYGINVAQFGDPNYSF